MESVVCSLWFFASFDSSALFLSDDEPKYFTIAEIGLLASPAVDFC